MKVKTGALITDLSGSLNGHTAQRKSGSLVLSGKKVYSKISGLNQSRSQSAILQASKAWRLLTPQVRTWYLKNEHNGLIGFHSFVYSCMICLKGGYPLPSVIPTVAIPQSFPTYSISAIAATQQMVFNFTTTLGNGLPTIISASRPFTESNQSASKSLKCLNYGTTTIPLSYNFSSLYVSRFGTFKAGMYVRFKIECLRVFPQRIDFTLWLTVLIA